MKLLAFILLFSIFLACRTNENSLPVLKDTTKTINTSGGTGGGTNQSNTEIIDGFITRRVITNLDVPWEILWGIDNMIWTTERKGIVSRIDPDKGTKTVILTLNDTFVSGEAGLLGMIFHPDFKNTPHVFLAYTYREGSVYEKIVRYTYDGKNLVEPKILLDKIEGNTTHIGARFLITADKKLLVSTGDAQNQPSAQNTSALTGKILRMNLDGTIPSDNPFPNSYTYSFGHRNAQGLLLHSNGILYSSEHGPNNDDEINIIEKGKNYGWPNVNGKIDNSEKDFATKNNVIESILQWTPTIAPSDLAWYGNDKIPVLKNKILMAVLKDMVLYAFTLSKDGKSIEKEEKFLSNKFGRLRDVLVAPDGRIFLATNGASWSNTDGGKHQIIEISGHK